MEYIDLEAAGLIVGTPEWYEKLEKKLFEDKEITESEVI